MTEQLKPFAGELNIFMNAKTDRTLTFTKDIDGVTVDLTGYTEAAFIVKEKPSSPDPAIINLTVTGGGIVLGGALGTATVTFTDTLLDLGDTSYSYSLVLTDASGNLIPWLVGKFVTQQRVS